MFDLPFGMIGAGKYSVETLSMFAYFENNALRYGPAAAYSIVLFLYIVVVAFLFVKLLGADVVGDPETKALAEARKRRHAGGGGYTPPYAAMVVDAKTGEVMYAKRADSPRYPASITKVMTLYLAFEALAAGTLTLHAPLTSTVA